MAFAHTPHPLLPSYKAASDPDSSISLQPLPAITRLPIKDAYQCPSCPHIAASIKVMNRHIHASHTGVSPLPLTSSSIKAQMLFKGPSTKCFKIIPPTNSDDSFIPLQFLKDLNSFTTPQSLPASTLDRDVKTMDAFLATMRFEIHLKSLGISMPNAGNLIAWNNSIQASLFRSLLSSYLKEAWNIANKNMCIKAHMLMNRPISISLKQQSIKRYETLRAHFLFFFLRINSVDAADSLNIHIPTILARSFRDLYNLTDSMPPSQALSILQSLFYTFFFVPITNENDITTSFISCYSVHCGSPSNSSSLRFKTATEMSPLLAALKYVAQCCAVYNTYVHPNSTSITKKWQVISDATDPNSDTGIIYLDFVIKLTHSIRPSEMQKIRFISCTIHSHFGFIDGNELSLQTLGEKMIQLQNKAFDLLNQRLLRNLDISQEFWNACSTFQDSLQDRTTNTWFAIHPAIAPVFNLWV